MQTRLTADRLNTDGCINLISFLVEEVCRDYADAYAMHLKNPHSQGCRKRRDTLRSYIMSDYFCNLTSLDGANVVELIEANHKSYLRRIRGGSSNEPYSQSRG